MRNQAFINNKAIIDVLKSDTLLGVAVNNPQAVRKTLAADRRQYGNLTKSGVRKDHYAVNQFLRKINPSIICADSMLEEKDRPKNWKSAIDEINFLLQCLMGTPQVPKSLVNIHEYDMDNERLQDCLGGAYVRLVALALHALQKEQDMVFNTTMLPEFYGHGNPHTISQGEMEWYRNMFYTTLFEYLKTKMDVLEKIDEFAAGKFKYYTSPFKGV